MKKYFTYGLCVFLPFLAFAQLTINNELQVRVSDGSRLDVTGNTLVESGGLLTLSGDMTVSGSFTNNGSNAAVIITSDATVNGSLIYGSGTPGATVNSYISSDVWHFVSPTTTGVTVNNYHFNFSPRSWLTYFNEAGDPSGTWVYMIDINDAVNVGQGYSLYIESTPQTVQYSGNLNATNKDLTTLTTPALAWTDASHGYNLIGNPFSSAIDFDGTWTMSNIDQNVWVWDESGDNYAAYSPSGGLGELTDGIIPLGQGFMVHATAGSPSLTIPASKRVHSSQGFYKSQNSSRTDPVPHIKIEFSKDQKADVVYVGFDENADREFNNGYDARKMFGPEDSPQAYLKEASLDLSIDVIHVIGNDAVGVDMSFIAGIEGTQQLTSTIYELEDISVELEDKKEGIIYDLVQSPSIEFTATKQDNPERFVLHFNRTTTDKEEVLQPAPLKIYSYKNVIYIKSTDLNNTLTVRITDLLGRNVFSRSYMNAPLISIPVNVTNGCYIVTSIQNAQITTEKVLIN